jgi:hypothetical protein
MNWKETCKVLSLISCVLLVINCTTSHPQQFQENKNALLSLSTNKSDTADGKNDELNELRSTFANMDESTFINLLNKDLDSLSRIEGVWSDDSNTYKIGIQKTKEKGEYVAFILNSQKPDMKKGEIIAEFYNTRYYDVYLTEYYLGNNKKIETKSYVSGQSKLQLTIFLDKLDKENIFFLKEYPEVIYH